MLHYINLVCVRLNQNIQLKNLSLNNFEIVLQNQTIRPVSQPRIGYTVLFDLH